MALDRARSLRPTILGWLPLVAGAALVTALAGLGVYWGMGLVTRARDGSRGPKPGAGRAAAVAGATRSRQTTGELRVVSTPTGAHVVVDGNMRGITPLTLTDLAVGSHVVELESPEGKIRRSVTIAGGEVASVNESIFAGWVAVYAPFDLLITEGDRSLHLDDRNQIMLPPGPHEFRLVNQAFEYEEVRRIELKPGEIATISVTPPRSTLTVTATEPAEIWLDGARVGESPLTGFPVDLGTHEVILKRAGAADRPFTITVTTKPFTLEVNFSKPARDT